MKVMRPWLVAPGTIEYREQEIHLTPRPFWLDTCVPRPAKVQRSIAIEERRLELQLSIAKRAEVLSPIPGYRALPTVSPD